MILKGKNFGSKGKYFENILRKLFLKMCKFLTDTIAKISQNN